MPYSKIPKMNEVITLTKQLPFRPQQIEATIRLFDAGNTIPFIARYRKEATGGLTDEEIQTLYLSLQKVRKIIERREAIKRSIEEQGHLTPKLAEALDSAESMAELEDLYAPYKPKRQTRGLVARENGLMPLAILILKQEKTTESLDALATSYLNEKVTTVDEAWQGARDIVAEIISENASLRQTFRRKLLKNGLLISKKVASAKDEKGMYELYYNFSHSISTLRPHQVLAINRGEKEGLLRVKLELTDHDYLLCTRVAIRPDHNSPLHNQLQMAGDDALKRLIIPSVDRDIRNTLTETAEAHATTLFAKNLQDLLLQPPIVGRTILAIDPGYRTGCKVCVIDETGRLLENTTIYPHEPRNHWDDALKRLVLLITRHHVTLIAIGNGTASRETEKLVAELTCTLPDLSYLMVNEAGASVYSASEVARQEFPDLDVLERGSVSIGRRVQDPLSELVKIDPRSIGVGLYQHDIDQKNLAETLDGVVELVVNRIGVDLNTASASLLTHIAGIGPKLSEKIIAYRNEHGTFGNRSQLQKVNGLGPKAYEQCAGFLRVYQSSNDLDMTSIHPESYATARKVMEMAEINLKMSEAEKEAGLAKLPPLQELATQLNVGLPTLTDILEQLKRPGRDPRIDITPPLLRKDILSMNDLNTGLVLFGTVRNIVDFGAFIDIGVKRDGLLHRATLPREIELAVGQVLQVAIKEVDTKRGRISLDWVEQKL